MPTLLLASDASDLPVPWSLESRWWQELVNSPGEDSEERIKAFMVSLKTLDDQVPEESREVVSSAVQRVSENIERYLQLRSLKGWAIQAAPTPQESYTVEEVLSAARQVKVDESQLEDSTDRLKRFATVLQQAVRRIDELTLEYSATPNKSLQRTMAGLSLMVMVTNRAVLEERIRIGNEELAGLEQTAKWNKERLSHARERLDLSSIGLAEVDIQIEESTLRERGFQKELLHIEAELLPNGSAARLDDRPLIAINKLIQHSRAQTQVIVGYAKKGAGGMASSGIDAAHVHSLLDSSKVWLQELGELKGQAAEWQGLIRREQDAAERLVMAVEEASTAKNRDFIEFQRLIGSALSSLDELDVEIFQASILARIVSDQAMDQLHWFACMWERGYFVVERVVLETIELLSYPLFRVSERPVTLLKIFRALAILAIAYGISVFFRRMLGKLANRKPYISSGSLYTFNRVTHYIILLVGLLWALSSIGVDFSSLLIIAGALSVGIGFGLQGIVNNFLGGLIVLFDQKLRVGDFIELAGGEMGHITEVNVQNTVIRTLTGHDILVPNSDIITRQLTNWTLRDQYARLHLPFGVAYGSDKEKVRQVVSEAARRVEETIASHRTLPDPNVWLVGFGDSALNFELVVWVDFKRSKKRQSSLRAAYYWEIETALLENELEIPFPQRDVHLKSGEESPKETVNT